MSKSILIAVTGRSTTISQITAYTIQQTYIDGLQLSGAIPLMIVPQPDQDYQQIADRCDGLLITGGRDVAPALYSQTQHASVETELLSVDQMDISLIKAFHEKNKPIFGICRGLQVINVAFGGTLIQDIPSTNPSVINHSQTTSRFETSHAVDIVSGTRLSRLLPSKLMINSLHHQAIDQVAPGFTISALAPDGIIEAIEGDNIMAVQWHPEGLLVDANHLGLFDSFVRQCKK